MMDGVVGVDATSKTKESLAVQKDAAVRAIVSMV
jgi:hypothetical protein